MFPKIIKTEEEYEAALQYIENLMDAPANSADGDKLELWATLVEKYEEEQLAIECPDPVSAIKFRMSQMNLKQKDLIQYVGSKSKVSEILSGKRRLTLAMIRKLSNGLSIPASILLQAPEKNEVSSATEDTEAGKTA